jgi:hypothetical protein
MVTAAMIASKPKSVYTISAKDLLRVMIKQSLPQHPPGMKAG